MAIIRVNSTNEKLMKEVTMLCQKAFEEKGYEICEVNRKMILKPMEEYESSILFTERRADNAAI